MPIIAFDIGGTWFRSAIVDDSLSLSHVSKVPAINYLAFPQSTIPNLQAKLVDYLVGEVSRLSGITDDLANCVAVSVGAAMNACTGQLLNSGPLWGPACQPFDLHAALAARQPGIRWHLVNDVTAAVLRQASMPRHSSVTKLAVVTVSTGVAMRIYDRRLDRVPVCREHGLQGEIGHLPITFFHEGLRIDLTCDCGGQNHLNAFCSGRGIAEVLRLLENGIQNVLNAPQTPQCEGGEVNLDVFLRFAESVRSGVHDAVRVLDSVTFPLAQMLTQCWTIDPEIERVVIVGGVVSTIGPTYLESLQRNLTKLGLYEVTSRDPNFFGERVVLGDCDDCEGLIGAAISAGRDAKKLHGVSTIRGVQSKRSIEYPIIEAGGCFTASLETPNLASLLGMRGDRCLVVLDIGAARHHLAAIESCLSRSFAHVEILTIEGGETAKCMENVALILEKLVSWGTPRVGEPILVIGGGAVLDCVGLAASLYRRGIPYVRIPSTLLSIVDASVGIKTGINFLGQKNIVGSFYPPLAVLVDVGFLNTVEPRQMSSGASEIIKIAIVISNDLFGVVEQNIAKITEGEYGFWGSKCGRHILCTSISYMIDELEPNLWEHSLERLVDFGHTFSQSIEMVTRGELLHGEAVAIDMAISTMVAWNRSLLPGVDAVRILSAISCLSLPIVHECCGLSLVERSLREAVRHRGGRCRIPLPRRIGNAEFFNDLTVDEIMKAIDSLWEWRPVADGR